MTEIATNQNGFSVEGNARYQPEVNENVRPQKIQNIDTRTEIPAHNIGQIIIQIEE